MSRLFRRAIRVIVGSQEILGGGLGDGLRVQFKVKKTTTKEPNDCEVSVFNLSEQHRAALQAKGTPVLVEAGYEDTTSLIFSGISRYIDHTHSGGDWVTKIQCGDGERAYRYAHVAESFRPGTRVADVFAKVASAMEIDATEAISAVRSMVPEQFAQGYSAFGKASTEVDRLLVARGLEWSIQDGRLQVLRKGAAAGGTVVLLSPTTGLVGSPSHGTPEHSSKTGKKKAPVLKAKALLQPAIRAGGTIQIESATIRGNYRVQVLTHSGDTHGGDWYSDVDCVPVT